MSWWGTIDAEFGYDDAETAGKAEATLLRQFEERTAPTGSEYGPKVRRDSRDDLRVVVYGRLRDVNDLEDSAEVLAWFTRASRLWGPERSSLTWDLDSGPRYRWTFADGELTKLRGVLDQ